jgi:hypothetical protein
MKRVAADLCPGRGALASKKAKQGNAKKELAFVTFYRSSLNMAMEVGHLKSPHLDRRMIAVTTARPR